ncbi:hypothetical protein ADUPG1_013117, partial [Aduncisulcus paluster]
VRSDEDVPASKRSKTKSTSEKLVTEGQEEEEEEEEEDLPSNEPWEPFVYDGQAFPHCSKLGELFLPFISICATCTRMEICVRVRRMVKEFAAQKDDDGLALWGGCIPLPDDLFNGEEQEAEEKKEAEKEGEDKEKQGENEQNSQEEEEEEEEAGEEATLFTIVRLCYNAAGIGKKRRKILEAIFEILIDMRRPGDDVEEVELDEAALKRQKQEEEREERKRRIQKIKKKREKAETKKQKKKHWRKRRHMK